jgi:hypothetical protein
VLDYDDATTLRQQLTELPELLVYAHLALEPGSTPAGGRVSGATREAPLPCRLDVLSALGPSATVTLDDRDQDGQTPILHTIQAWALYIGGQYPALVGRTVGAQITLLLVVHDWACQQDWAPDYAAGIARVHRTAARLGSSPIGRRPVRAACPRCRLRTMQTRQDGCRECCDPDCATVLTPDEYDTRAEKLAGELNAVA